MLGMSSTELKRRNVGLRIYLKGCKALQRLQPRVRRLSRRFGLDMGLTKIWGLWVGEQQREVERSLWLRIWNQRKIDRTRGRAERSMDFESLEIQIISFVYTSKLIWCCAL